MPASPSRKTARSTPKLLYNIHWKLAAQLGGPAEDSEVPNQGPAQGDQENNRPQWTFSRQSEDRQADASRSSQAPPGRHFESL